MASQGDRTRVGGATPPPTTTTQPPDGSGVELTTLFLSAVASAAAAYITSKIWARGTLFSAAMSPVIVALVKEGLRKPTEVVANVVPSVVSTPARWTRTSPDDPGLVAEPAGPPAPPPADPDAPHVILPPVVGAQTGPVRVYSTRASRLRWRLAVITGLLGFGICVVLYTVPELISGKSIGRSGDATTIFGGHRKNTNKTSTQTTTSTTSTSTTDTTPTTTNQAQTVTQTQTVPAPAATPSTAAPAPQTTTPAPSTAAPAGGQVAPPTTTP
jgi:hypothetical protein